VRSRIKWDAHMIKLHSEVIQPLIDAHHRRVALIYGFCSKCVFGYPDCPACGGTGVSREILRQTF
jgi:hypothetical protein